MKCKHCKEEMMDDVVICPACGGDNTNQNKRKTVAVIAVICCVAVILGIVAMFMGMNPAEEGRITQKATYIVSDEAAKSKANLVVATAGDFELTNGELQVLYWSMVYDFVSYAGDYAAYYIDFTKPLSEQYYNVENKLSWEHYFLEMALGSWLRYEVLSAEAEKAGITLTAEMQDSLNNIRTNMEADLENLKLSSVEEMVQNDYGKAATFADLMSYMEIYYKGNNYYNHLYDQIELTDAELEAYYTENAEQLEKNGYGKNQGSLVNARHILIEPVDESPEEIEIAKQKAQDLMDQWVAAGAKEEDFAELAKEHSACSSAPKGGLLGYFSKGQMVQPFENWCFAEGHEYGDYGLVLTDYGWHIIFFVEEYVVWEEAVTANLKDAELREIMTEMEKQYSMNVKFEDIVLANVPLL